MNKEVFRMTFLTQQFQRYIQAVEHVDASGCRTANLKQICSEVVFVDTLAASDIAEDKVKLTENNSESTHTSTEIESETEELPVNEQSAQVKHSLGKLFASSMHLRDVVNNHNSNPSS